MIDRSIDLDAAQAERVAAAGGEPPHIVKGGKKYFLPVELSGEFLLLIPQMTGGARPEILPEIMNLMLGDEVWEELRPLLSTPDMLLLIEKIPEKYGLNLGELQGSLSLSETTSES